MFFVFINDLGSVLKKSYKLYADDTVIYTDYTKTDVENVVSDLQADLNNINNWCRMNEICINISKSKSMAFGTRYQVKHCDPPNVTLGNIGLEIVPHYNYLGLYYKLGLHLNTIDWFRSYLASRTQITSVNQIQSDIAPVTCRVP